MKLVIGFLIAGLWGCGGGGGVGPDISGTWRIEGQWLIERTAWYYVCEDTYTPTGTAGEYTGESSCAIGPKEFTLGKIVSSSKVTSKKKKICDITTEYGWEDVEPPRSWRGEEREREFRAMAGEFSRAMDEVDWNEDPCSRIVEAKERALTVDIGGSYAHWTRR